MCRRRFRKGLAANSGSVRATIAEHLGINQDALKPNTTLSTLGIDSLRAIELVLTLEDRFGVNLPDEAWIWDQQSPSMRQVVLEIRNRKRNQRRQARLQQWKCYV